MHIGQRDRDRFQRKKEMRDTVGKIEREESTCEKDHPADESRSRSGSLSPGALRATWFRWMNTLLSALMVIVVVLPCA